MRRRVRGRRVTSLRRALIYLSRPGDAATGKCVFCKETPTFPASAVAEGIHTRLSNGKSCANGAFSPLLETRNQRNPQSLYNPGCFEICTHKLKKGVCAYISQNTKIPAAVPPIRRGKTVGIFNAAFIETGEIHASHTATALQFSK